MGGIDSVQGNGEAGGQVTHSTNVGRPRTITHEALCDLVDLLAKGYTVSLACIKAKLPTSVFYAELARNEEFRDKITAAKDVMTTRAMNVVDESLLRREVKTAMWLLDRQDRRERNAQRAKEYRLIKKLTVTKSYQETQSLELEIDTLTD